ncbi:cell wall-binding repeat-containing protein [Raoultibacter phocaeensis]|uniref:cell wall-binding repeat-containing protein n=1 Tax=Raoultibacter phocaeensis TaxID=2479841 RepID=UPI001118DE54|nr:cell wall-binding repeat-containing protein [Raoultibacter phocaeensis]
MVRTVRNLFAFFMACALACMFLGTPLASAYAEEAASPASGPLEIGIVTDEESDASHNQAEQYPPSEDPLASPDSLSHNAGNGPAFPGDATAYAPLSSPTTQAELQQALISASSGTTIELSQDIVIDGNGMTYDHSSQIWSPATDVPLFIPYSLSSITIDGNGYSLKLAPGYTGLHINAEDRPSASRTITLKDLVLEGHNVGIDPATALDVRLPGGGMHVDGLYTTLAWNNVTMTGVHGIGTGGGLVNYGCKVVLTDCTIKDVSATSNGGFYTSSGGGNSYGGGLTMNGGTVTGARSGGNGGFALLSGGSHILTGVTFEDCSAAGEGGAISNAQGSSTYALVSCTFTGNSSGGGGGAVHAQNGGHTITDCTFTGNTAGTNPSAWLKVGGALYLSHTTQSNFSTISGCAFTNNTATDDGAVYGQGFDFANVRFIGNSATAGSGGAVNCNPHTWFTLNGGYFEDNFASTGQLNWDVDNPQSCLDSGLAFSDLANHYKANVADETGLTAQAANARVAPSNCMNNYDIAPYPFTTYFLTTGTGAVWSDRGTDAQRSFNVGTQTISDAFDSRSISVSHEDGKRLLGWWFPIGQLTSGGVPVTFEGYGDDPYVISYGVNDALLKAQGFDESAIVDESTYVIRGSYHYLVPIWEDRADLVYHPDSSTQVADPDGPFGMLTETPAKSLGALGAESSAPEGQVLVGWALTEHTVDGETLYAPGDSIVVETDDLEDGEVHLYARYGDAPDPFELSVARLYGEHRYATSKQVSTYERTTENTVILASGDDYHFPDALTASSLSGHLGNAPIVLTPTDWLTKEASTAINDDLSAGTVIIIGDQYAVSNEVEAAVRALPSVADVQRIGGVDRQHTAELINDEIGSDRYSTAIIARSDDFPDSLTISSWSAITTSPIFLTENGSASLTAETKAALASGGFNRVIVLGDQYAVADSALEEAKAAAGLTDAQVIRLGGVDRYHTSSLVAEWTTSNDRSDFERLCWEKPAIARGDVHADSLTGGALQGRDRSPVLLTNGSAASDYATALLAAQDGLVSELRFFGDHYAISIETTKAFISTLTWDSISWKPDDGVAIDLT